MRKCALAVLRKGSRDAGVARTKSITTYNRYYVKWIMLYYQGLSFFTTAPIVFLLRFGAFPSFFCTGTANQASPRG